MVLETSAAGGTDQVSSSVTFTLGSNVEDLILTGANPINGTGNGQANTLTGNGVANILNGLAGDDTAVRQWRPRPAARRPRQRHARRRRRQ